MVKAEELATKVESENSKNPKEDAYTYIQDEDGISNEIMLIADKYLEIK